MYRIYYLTSEKDFNIPMYVGMTKLQLNERLKHHKHKRHNYNKNDKWKKERQNKISIHLIQDNFLTFKDCSKVELFWINFWKSINSDLKNTITHELSEHPYINTIENIKRNISEGVIRKKCRNIVALDKNQNILSIYRTIKSASLELHIKEEIITNSLKERTKSNKYIFIYEDDFDKTIDYSYKLYNPKTRKKCNIKPIVSISCRNAVKKQSKIKNILTNEILIFNTQTEASKFLGFSDSYYNRIKNKNKPCNDIYLLL